MIYLLFNLFLNVMLVHSDDGLNVACNHEDTGATEKQLSPIAEGSIQGKFLNCWLHH